MPLFYIDIFLVFSSTLLGTLSRYVYVNISGTDHINCGSRPQPCQSLSYTINNVSRPNDKIYLIASPLKEIRYSLEKQIIIKHSLTITKYPLVGLNPVIIYRVNASSSSKEFYSFSSFRPTAAAAAAAAEMLSLKVKSVNFHVNIFSTFSEGYRYTGKNMFGDISGCRLLFSISNSIINSPYHAINLSDLTGYENVSIHVEDSIIQNGKFVFQNNRKSCEPTEHIKNIIQMKNVTVLNTGNTALSANGCFKISFNKITCCNNTWKKEGLFTFGRASLKMQNILIENILPSNDQSEEKALFLIESCDVEIQNLRIKDCKVPSSMWLHKTLAVFLLQNSIVKMENMKMIGNSFQSLARVESSLLIINNITLSNNIFNGTLYSVEKSNLKLNDAEFRNNSVGSLIHINLNSCVLITNNILSRNTIHKNGYSLVNGIVRFKNVALTRNNLMKNMLHLTSKSSAIIQNNTLNNNSVSKAAFNISNMSRIQINNIVFAQNKLLQDLLYMESNSSAVIDNNILNENNVSKAIYNLSNTSSIQLHNVRFTRNNLMQDLLVMHSNSTAIIKNNILTENNVSRYVYFLENMSSIQLHNVTFTRRNLMSCLLYMLLNSSAIVNNNTIVGNNMNVGLFAKYSNLRMDTILFQNNTFKKHFIWVSFSKKVSLDLMRITENRFLGSIIEIKNCVGRLANTDIKNDGHRSVEAISVTWTYEYDKYFLFELTNNTITWSSGSSLSFRPIIDLTGRIKISNVNVLVFSIADIEVLRYSTKPILVQTPVNVSDYSIADLEVLRYSTKPILMQRPVNVLDYPIAGLERFLNLTQHTLVQRPVNVSNFSIPDIKVLRFPTKPILVQRSYNQIFFNTYEISSLLISCRRANVKHIATHDTIRCTPCLQDTYTLLNGSLNISSKSLGNKEYTLLKESKNFTCDDCPAGANCTEHIKSKGNFYGYITKQQKAKFVPCPLNFCCSADQCKTIISCNKGRTGTLCGKCSKSNTESFLSTNCISVNLCKNFGTFWLIYCAYALSLATCLYYMRDLIILIKTTGGKVSKVFKFFQKERKDEDETDEMISIIGSEEHPEEKVSHFTMSGIFALIVSFYQIKEVMAVDVKYGSAGRFSFITVITKFINLEIVAMNSASYCPMTDLNAVSKAFIKTYLLTFAFIMASLMNYLISRIYYSFGGKIRRESSLKPSDRLGVCLIRVLMLSYKNIATASLMLLNCVEVAGIRVLHVNGNIKCFEWWQVIVAVFFSTWIMFFPLSLKLSYTMFMKDEITFPKCIFSLMVPFVLVLYRILNRNVVSVVLQKPRNVSKVQRILQEMFEESYRVKKNDSRRESVFYETWRLYQRVLLTIAATYFINPLVRITFMTPIITLNALFYFVYRPYKPEMYILHLMELVSILGFFVCLTHNMFRGFLYVYDIKHEDHVTLIWEAFTIADQLYSPIWVLFWFFIIKPVYSKVKNAIKKRM